MANQEKYAQQMQDAGVCDARGAALCATVKELPDGSFGMVLLGVKGNDLLIYDTNMKSEPLKLMRTIPLKGVTDFSTTSLMGEILKGYTFRFTSDGFTYSFKNCRRQAFLDVLQQEINKKHQGLRRKSRCSPCILRSFSDIIDISSIMITGGRYDFHSARKQLCRHHDRDG